MVSIIFIQILIDHSVSKQWRHLDQMLHFGTSDLDLCLTKRTRGLYGLNLFFFKGIYHSGDK